MTVESRYSQHWISRYYQILNLIRLHKPKSIVEVGTFDGKRACGMLAEAIRHHPEGGVTYTGYDLFETATPELDRQEFNLRNHPPMEKVQSRMQDFCNRYPGRVQFRLIKGNTRETLKPQNANLAFIDGGHSVETIQSDYEALKGSDIVILDDYYRKDRQDRCPDLDLVGCNNLVTNCSEFHILPVHNEVSGGGRVQMAVKFSPHRLCGVRLQADGPLCRYFYHSHNCGHPADLRRTERTVEVGVARQWMQGLDGPPIEIGAVTPYYFKYVQEIVDPADDKATDRRSLFEVDVTGRDVLSLSTIEHVGGDQYGLRESKTPLDAFRHLSKANRFLISFPYGWPNAENLQKYILDQREQLAQEGVKVHTVTRQSDETWKPSSNLLPYGDRQKPWANTVIFVEKGGLV